VQYPTIVLHSFPPLLLADRQRHEACTIPLSSVDPDSLATVGGGGARLAASGAVRIA
jgi:hypothetical protein